ncbi:natural killer cells antigen CD94-like [Rhinoderma darwinii]|uniref:natural killer cells antigen CD94-like n=1 Tax=Rhinoderma darwinii TaxID=43563 RepID=UPI003F66A47B
MDEEITYADLRFNDSSNVSTSRTLEKNTEVTSSEHNVSHCRCQKKMYIIIGILVCVLLLLLVMTISLLQASEKQNYYRARIQIMSQTMSNVKDELCTRNEGDQKESCLLCPMNWVLIQKKCYYMPDKTLSWNESQGFCSAQNSSLIMPKTYQEGEFIICNFRRWMETPLWIGLSCSLKSNEKWLWLDNTTYSSLPCRNMKCAYLDYGIFFSPCSQKLKLVCEKLPVNLPDIN